MKKWVPLVWLSFVAAAGWVLSDRLRAIEFDDIVRQLRALPTPVILTGILCCAGCYSLVGIYEGIAVRVASGRRAVLQPFRTALIANPIGRAIGVALVSGGALRYRMYASIGLTARQVGAIIVLVAMPYLLAVGWLIDLSLLLNAQQASRTLHLSTTVILTLGALGLVKDIGWLTFVARRRRPIVIRGQSMPLPTLRDTVLQTAFGLAQISLMTAILYLFMPPELGMSWPAFIAIYCIAFVAGQMSNVPAGLGILEAALLLMLPHVPPGKLLGAVLAYRAVFEVLPLLLAIVLLLIFETTHPSGVVRRRA
ncbi:MAG: lysylphosphatidylglycerol synthase transmembrane domain-containing protein [Steroidobacter sp.]